MRRLILFRHAKAEASQGGGDFARALTERGRRDAEAMGRRLAQEGEAPDIVLISSAARTRQTWAVVKAAFGETRIELRDALYNASAQGILEHIRAFEDDGETLMVIGHNPGLQELAVRLLAEGSAAPRDIRTVSDSFPTAAVAIFSVDEAGRCALEAFDRPGEAR